MLFAIFCLAPGSFGTLAGLELEAEESVLVDSSLFGGSGIEVFASNLHVLFLQVLRIDRIFAHVP